MNHNHVVVLDIGKTNVKVVLVDTDTMDEIDVVTRPNIVFPGPPWPHFDIQGIWDFLLTALTEFHAKYRIDALSVTAHGACVVLLDHDGNLAAPVLDYEHTGPDLVKAEYEKIRPSFAETGSPRLGMGLNVGAQLFWQFKTDPSLQDRVKSIVTYPQYWSYLLTGVASTDVTSLGCHTDLWNPKKGCFSTLCDILNITEKMAPTKLPSDVLGYVLPGVSELPGLRNDTPVVCGIHDSNASLLPYILTEERPFSVVSTGTWVISMSMGDASIELDPTLDTLINVNALGDPVPSSRFMGGREYELESDGLSYNPALEIMQQVLEEQIMLLPAVVPETGPFKGRKSKWLNSPPNLCKEQREVALSFYLALTTAHCLELIGHQGAIILEGPFSKNRAFCEMLFHAADTKVFVSGGSTGTSLGATLLFYADGADRLGQKLEISSKLDHTSCLNYLTVWKEANLNNATEI